jgi:hypothetical protein
LARVDIFAKVNIFANLIFFAKVDMFAKVFTQESWWYGMTGISCSLLCQQRQKILKRAGKEEGEKEGDL